MRLFPHNNSKFPSYSRPSTRRCRIAFSRSQFKWNCFENSVDTQYSINQLSQAFSPESLICSTASIGIIRNMKLSTHLPIPHLSPSQKLFMSLLLYLAKSLSNYIFLPKFHIMLLQTCKVIFFTPSKFQADKFYLKKFVIFGNYNFATKNCQQTK